MIKVISLDPGITTGYAQGIIEEDEPMKVGNGQDRYNHLGLSMALQKFYPDIIICESFDYRPGLITHSDVIELYSRELIGIVNLYVQIEQMRTKIGHNVELVMQKPSYAVGKQPYFNDSKLKELGVYSIANPHANDATRHLLQWYEFGPGYKYNTKGIVAA